ncbi:UPF0705 protein C11orf49 homolog [Xenia sp. Carnegie-2017]|uniref:UPF0705 protein C11orf49 homolog n=1 Tax=Xenia sp. Carnegie-2017 TaxID=2897299 RepID=UPI001F03BBA1|nr:UPF0705 protein C11orf49 homolog [Xenia sp. Carnegie-2017]
MSFVEKHKKQHMKKKYLERHHVMTYLQDAISQLLLHKEDNPYFCSSRFLCEYFSCIVKGNHTLFREYNFVRATPHNRSSFIAMFSNCFKTIGQCGDLLSVKEYHSLLSLICSDFPIHIVQKSARIVLMEDAMDCLMSFSDFFAAFQIQLYYEEFLDKCSVIYDEIASGSRRCSQVVVVPTSDLKSESPKNMENFYKEDRNNVNGIDCTCFYNAILHRIVYHSSVANAIRVPHVAILKQVLSSANRVTFYGYLMALAKNNAIRQSIDDDCITCG